MRAGRIASLGLVFVVAAVGTAVSLLTSAIPWLSDATTVMRLGLTFIATAAVAAVVIVPLGFGISVQLPLVRLFLERIGIFDVQAYLSKWRIAILVIFVLAMFLTPADPTSMILMAAPLTVLYFLGVLLCKCMPRRSSPFEEIGD